MFNSLQTNRCSRSLAMGAVLGSLAIGGSLANAGSLSNFDQLMIDMVIDGAQVQDAQQGSFHFDLPMEFKPAGTNGGAHAQSGASDQSGDFVSNSFEFTTTANGIAFGATISGLNKTNIDSISENIQVVPLPSAALAGLGMLAGFAGFGYLRSRR